MGTAERLSTRLTSAPASDLGALNWYTVKRGESSGHRRAQAAASLACDLAEANHLGDPVGDSSRAGPDHPARPRDAPRVSDRASGAGLGRVARASAAPRRSRGEPRQRGQRGHVATAATTYRVKRGDTLFSIARLFDTTVDKLRSLNRLRGSHISVGDRLTVRGR